MLDRMVKSTMEIQNHSVVQSRTICTENTAVKRQIEEKKRRLAALKEEYARHSHPMFRDPYIHHGGEDLQGGLSRLFAQYSGLGHHHHHQDLIDFYKNVTYYCDFNSN